MSVYWRLLKGLAIAPTLHHTSMVGGKPQAALCDVDVHLVCEIDRLEELVQRPGRAGNSSEEGKSGGRALRFDSGMWERHLIERKCQVLRGPVLGLCKIDVL